MRERAKSMFMQKSRESSMIFGDVFLNDLIKLQNVFYCADELSVGLEFYFIAQTGLRIFSKYFYNADANSPQIAKYFNIIF